ncbi:hypothetical protein DITRI_Ditri01bG0085800 [Diplodiscus trichospermus]
MKVSDLMIPNSIAWDFELLEELFNARDIAQISKIPFISNIREDQRIWAFSNDGNYSVKTGYGRAMQILNNDIDLRVPGDWRKFWSLKILPKVRTFAWRTVRYCLPTRENLRSRGIHVPITCVLCGSEVENNWHLLITRPFTKACWTEAGLITLINLYAARAESFSEWFFQLLSTTKAMEMGHIVTIKWSIWSWLGARQSLPGSTQNQKEPEAAITWKRPPMNDVIFETDAKRIVDAIMNSKEDLPEFGLLISSIQAILTNEYSYRIQFIRRQTNKDVHALAKAACTYASPHYWPNVPLFFV